MTRRTKKRATSIPHPWWLFAAAVAAGWLLFASGLFATEASLPIQQLAGKSERTNRELQHCLEESYSYACWKNAFQHAVQRMGPEYTLAWAHQEFEGREEYRAFCHPATHLIGQAQFSQTKSISAAFAVVTTAGNVCSSGFYHGVLEAAVVELPSREFEQQLPRVCDDFKDGAQTHQRYNCLHGIGHGLVGYRQDDWRAALKDCEQLQTDWEQRSCAGGVFMQNLVNMDPDLGHTADFRKDDLQYPCSTVSSKWKGACYRLQVAYWMGLHNGLIPVADLCRQLGAYTKDCFIGMGNNVAGRTYGQADTIIAACLTSGSGAGQCLFGVAQDYVYHYGGRSEAHDLCKRVPTEFLDDCHEGIKRMLSIPDTVSQ